MTRFLVLALFSLTGSLLSVDIASAQWGNRRHADVQSGGHLEYHNGHIDYHQPGQYDIHNGRLDYHAGRVNHLVLQSYGIPQNYGYNYPSSVYRSYSGVVSSNPVYSTHGRWTIVSGYPSTPVITGGTAFSAAPSAVNTMKPPVVSGTAANALPTAARGPAPNSRPITIRNPQNYLTPLTFELNDEQIRLESGEETTFTFDRAYTIEFDRGGQYGTQRYWMEDGSFEFRVGDRGWDLRRYTRTANDTPQPNNPTPANRLPGNLPTGGN
jgi:hypothetical protein